MKLTKSQLEQLASIGLDTLLGRTVQKSTAKRGKKWTKAQAAKFKATMKKKWTARKQADNV